jgi:hypothetical protein
MAEMEARAMAIRAKSRRVEDAFELFQLEKRGDRVSPATLEFYQLQVGKFLRWLDRECPEALRLDGLDGTVLRRYRADLAGSLTRHGKPLQAESLRTSHRGVMAFLRWAADAGFAVDEELLRLRPPRREHKEATVYHISQVRQILAKCENRTEELAVKILVSLGAGMAAQGAHAIWYDARHQHLDLPWNVRLLVSFVPPVSAWPLSTSW